ncbi:MAG: hypothetical protein ABW007_19065 [Chitinophagaceae bacterium]
MLHLHTRSGGLAALMLASVAGNTNVDHRFFETLPIAKGSYMDYGNANNYNSHGRYRTITLKERKKRNKKRKQANQSRKRNRK